MYSILAQVFLFLLLALCGCTRRSGVIAAKNAVGSSPAEVARALPIQSVSQLAMPSVAASSALPNSGPPLSYVWNLSCGDGDVTNAAKAHPSVAFFPGIIGAKLPDNFTTAGPQVVVGLWAVTDPSNPVPSQASFIPAGYLKKSFPVSFANNTNLLTTLATADSTAAEKDIAGELAGAINDVTDAIGSGYPGNSAVQIYATALTCNQSSGPSPVTGSASEFPSTSQAIKYFYKDLPAQLSNMELSGLAGAGSANVMISYSGGKFSANVVSRSGSSQLFGFASELFAAGAASDISLPTATTLASMASVMQNNRPCQQLAGLLSGSDAAALAQDPFNLGTGTACSLLMGLGSGPSFAALVSSALGGSVSAIKAVAERLAASAAWVNTPFPSNLLGSVPTCLPASGLAINSVLNAAPIPLRLGANNQIQMSGAPIAASVSPEASFASYVDAGLLYFDASKSGNAARGDITTLFSMFAIGMGTGLAPLPSPVNPSSLAASLIPGSRVNPLTDASQLVLPGAKMVTFVMRSLAQFPTRSSEVNPVSSTAVANPSCAPPAQSGSYCMK